MKPAARSMIQAGILIAVIGLLFLIFPRAFAFTEMAARELLYFWWLILLVALGIWLIWGFPSR
jgi:hypothetical protein